MYKIAVFADIHANYEALKVIIDDIEKRNFNEVICLGDVLSKGASPRECFDLIIDNNVKMVYGNHEGKAQELWAHIVELKPETNGNLYWCMCKLEEKHKNFIMSLKQFIELRIDNKSFLFTHYPFNKETKKYFPYKDLNDEIAEEYFKDYNYDYVFFGHHHNHKHLKYKYKNLYNLGSSGCREDEYTFYYVITINNDKVSVRRKRLKYDREALKKTIVESDSPNKSHLASSFFNFNV